MFDEKGRLFGRINVVDLLVIIAVILVVGFIGYKVLVVNPQIAPVAKNYRVKLLVEEVRQPTIDELKPGTPVKTYDANAFIGNVGQVDVKPAIKLVEAANGQIVAAEAPGKFDITISIDGVAQVTDWSIKMGNTDIRVGLGISMAGQRFLVKGIIIGIEER